MADTPVSTKAFLKFCLVIGVIALVVLGVMWIQRNTPP